MEERAIKNIVETLIDQNLDVVLSGYDCCKCDLCRMDIKAYALNHLPPKYVATHMGGLYAKVDNSSFQNNAYILSAIANAIDVVSKHPRHD